jgi:hypothetical protein
MASRSECVCDCASLCVSECVPLEGRGPQEFLESSLPLSQYPKSASSPYLLSILHLILRGSRAGEGLVLVSSSILSSGFQALGSPERILGRTAGALVLNRIGGQSVPWHCLCPRSPFPLGHTHSFPPTLFHHTDGGLPIIPSASWSHSWDYPLHLTPPTPFACSHPGSHPALTASARMATDTLLTHADMRAHGCARVCACAHASARARAHTHTHTHRVTDI